MDRCVLSGWNYTCRILKGARTTELSVVQSSKLDQVIKKNVETARILGLTVPPQLPARADEVIE
jgi:putative ABC transport system substrate-binding protein